VRGSLRRVRDKEFSRKLFAGLWPEKADMPTEVRQAAEAAEGA
jgi:hypothetical protein